MEDALDFIAAKGLHRVRGSRGGPDKTMRVKATGGGAYKYADIFKEKVRMLQVIARLVGRRCVF